MYNVVRKPELEMVVLYPHRRRPGDILILYSFTYHFHDCRYGFFILSTKARFTCTVKS